MSKLYALALFLFIFTAPAIAQADRYWVGATGGNWTTAGNWSLTAGGAGGAGAPTSLQNAIFDGFVGTVNYDAANITINSLRIINAADVSLSNPVATAKTITVNDGLSTNQDLRVDATSKLTLTTGTGISANMVVSPFGALVDGIVILRGGGTPSSSGGRIDASNATVASPVEFNGTLELQEACSNTAGTNFKFNAGSFYIIKKNGGNVPAGVWSANALIEYRGGQTVATNAAPTLNGPPPGGFGKFTWNVSNQSGTLNLALTTLGVTFNGDFTVQNTNGQILRLATTLTNMLVKGNLIIQSGAAVSMTNSGSAPTGGTSLTVEGHLNINSGSFDLQENASGANSLLKLAGNLNIAAGATLTTTVSSLSTNEIELNGTLQQTLTAAGNITGQTRIRVNNSAGIVSATNLTLPTNNNSRLTLTTGNLNMGANLLFIQNPSTTALAGGTASSHIIGKLRRATNTAAVAYVFPVSNSATEVATVKVYPADATSNQYEVEFFRPNTYPRDVASFPAGIAGISNYYWDITRPAGSAAADLQFVYGGLANNGGITATGDVRVLHWTGSAPWQNLGGTDAGGNAVDVAGVTSFSPFALGSATQSLPTRLLSFSGYRQNNANVLKWTTATEQDSKGFYIDRSIDGTTFSQIGFVASKSQAGTSNAVISYDYTDNLIATGQQQYYRLRQADINGRETRSGIIIVRAGMPNRLAITVTAPNPVKNVVNVMINSSSRQNVTIDVYDAGGRVLKTTRSMVYDGSNTIALNLAGLKAGTYSLRVTGTGKETCNVMIFKQ